MTYKEATELLFNSTPLFQNIGKDAYKEGLYNTEQLDCHFGHPHRKYRTIHIAGTNGKGSCSHMLAAILQSAGYKVGLYTSPHLTDFRERIRVNGEMIPEHYVTSFVEDERHFYEPLHPSFFELSTALAFKYFAEAGVDVAVIEVGLGGRLDCTNIIRPDLSVITNISFDHVQFLGDTLEKIAGEKAGIIKPGVPVIIGETQTETKPVFIRKSQEMNAKIRFAEEEHQITSSQESHGGRIFDTKDYGMLQGELGGLCQERNAATILAAIDELRTCGYKISTQAVRDGFARVCELTGLRGRWQTLQTAPTVICDTGHNPGGLVYIARQLEQATCEHLRIVIGMVSDKDVSHSLGLLPQNAVYYFTKAKVKRALDEHALQDIACGLGLQGQAFADVETAFRTALADASPRDLIFVGGSTFIVADLLSFYGKK